MSISVYENCPDFRIYICYGTLYLNKFVIVDIYVGIDDSESESLLEWFLSDTPPLSPLTIN